MSIPKGRLPVFSVDTEEEARELLVYSCPINRSGQFVAGELVEEQTLENLAKFSTRLEEAWEEIQKNKKRKASHGQS